jgi:hypothetical protein
MLDPRAKAKNDMQETQMSAPGKAALAILRNHELNPLPHFPAGFVRKTISPKNRGE